MRTTIRSVAVLAWLAATACRSETPLRNLNVLVVDIDTLRADRLGTYGAKPSPSPFIDTFAAGAVVFDWAIATAPYTPPSQTSILTGLYPIRHGVWTRADKIPEEAGTLAEFFRGAGYRTVGFTGGGFMSRAFGFDAGFDEFNDGGLALEELADVALDAARERASGSPLFLFLHTYHVHTPYDPEGVSRENWVAVDGPASKGFEPTAAVMEAARRASWGQPPDLPPAQDLAYARSLYDGEIAEVDRWFWGLVSALDGSSSEGWIVALISDHGEAFGEQGSVLHETLYLPVTRVPLVIRAPGFDPLRVGCAVSLVDFAPTLLDLAGIALRNAPGMDGVSRVSAMRGEACRSFALSQSGYFRDKPALLLDEFHYVADRRSGEPQFFRYREDPTEVDNLAIRDPQTAQALRLEAERIIDVLSARRLEPLGTVLPQHLVEELRSLGYAQ